MRRRTFKYSPFIVAIKDDLIYSPAVLIALGEMRGLHRNLEGDALEIQRIRVWKTLRSYARKYMGFHDGMVETSSGTTPAKGWFGYRWKRLMGQDSWNLGIQELKDLGTLHLELPDAEVRVSRSDWQARLVAGVRPARPVYPHEEEILAMRKKRSEEHAEALAKAKARGQAIVDICRGSAERRGKK